MFSIGLALVDGVDGYLAASTIDRAASGEGNAGLASRWLVIFAFGLAGAELLGFEIGPSALPLGLTLFAIVIAMRVWARRLAVRQPGMITGRAMATS